MSTPSHHERLVSIIRQKDTPPPLVQMQAPPTSNVFSENISAQMPPPNVVPEEMLADFTLQGDVPLLYWYFDNRNFSSTPVCNRTETYENIFCALDANRFDYYGADGKAFFDTLTKYPVESKKVTIWGLTGCNCEALAVWAGASRVLVVEYNKPICDHPKIAVYNQEEFTALSIRTDFAISYSSFEHDGLGRYGDPLMPDGDLRAMRQAWNSLTDDGIMFLGVPLGPDCLVWNAHRIYGKQRLPILLRGWQLLDVFSVYQDETPEFPFDIPLGEHRRQCLMVLKKIITDWPTDEYLLRCKEQKPGTMASATIFNRINKMVFEHKHSSLPVKS